ncbi:MAG: hypothetical protein JKY53_07600 [Flavobacteriales bacterium]|nr:hypothetical protein [Flavobacteriales bacterium]
MPQLRMYLFFTIVVSLYSCGENNTNTTKPADGDITQKEVTLSNLDWINGKWIGEINGNQIVEIWEKLSDVKFKGSGYSILENDTTIIELLSLEVIDGEIYYSADVEENKKIVSFRLVSEKPNQFIFENKENDFPTRIRYTYQEPNNLHVVISGDIEGKRKEIDFYFKKEQ